MNPILDKVNEILTDFTTVSVTTTVTDGDDRSIKTEINVVDGDASFTIHKDLIPANTNLAELHSEQVEHSMETIARTMEALADLGERIGDKLEGYLEANSDG